jgi:ABC-2 type transport system permease protein
MMARVWLVARWEFLATLMRASFLIGALALPLVHLGLAALLSHAARSAARDDKPTAIAVVDAAHVLGRPTLAGGTLDDDEARAIAELRAGRLDAVFVLAADYLGSGHVRSYIRRTPGLFVLADTIARRDRAAALIRRGLVAQLGSPATANRIAEPVTTVERFALDRSGRVRPDNGSLGFVGGAFGLCFLMSLSIFFASGPLQQAMAAERQNRMLEVLLSLTPPLPLLVGKVVGLAAVSLIQMGVYLALMLGAAPVALAMFDIPPATIAWSIACCAVGYIFHACLMAATGALGRDTQESAQIAMPWMFLGASPLFLIASVGANPTSGLARALSWIPLTSPVTLLLRLGAEGVSAAELAGALLLTLASAIGVLLASARLVGYLAVAGGRVPLWPAIARLRLRWTSHP